MEMYQGTERREKLKCPMCKSELFFHDDKDLRIIDKILSIICLRCGNKWEAKRSVDHKEFAKEKENWNGK